MKEQVVVINSGVGYGATSYYDQEKVEVIDFDFTAYDDEYPDSADLKFIRARMDKVTNKEALEFLEEWFHENTQYWEEVAREDAIRDEQDREEEIRKAKETLIKYGVLI